MNIDETKYQSINHEDGRIEFVPIKPKLDVGWVPKNRGDYFFVGVNGDDCTTVWTTHEVDQERLAFHNVFPSRKMADAASEDMRRANAVIRASRLADPDYVPDWTKDNIKCAVYYDYALKDWNTILNSVCQLGSSYVSSQEKAEQVRNYLRAWGVK